MTVPYMADKWLAAFPKLANEVCDEYAAQDVVPPSPVVDNIITALANARRWLASRSPQVCWSLQHGHVTSGGSSITRVAFTITAGCGTVICGAILFVTGTRVIVDSTPYLASGSTFSIVGSANFNRCSTVMAKSSQVAEMKTCYSLPVGCLVLIEDLTLPTSYIDDDLIRIQRNWETIMVRTRTKV
jgi:hypothetical protein